MKRIFLVLCMLVTSCVYSYDAADDNVLLWFFDDPVIQEIDGSYIKTSDLVGRGEADGLTANMIRISATDSDGNTTYLGLKEQYSTFDYFDGFSLPDWYGDNRAGPGYASLLGLNLNDTGIVFAMEIGYAEFGDDFEITKWQILASGTETLNNLINSGHIQATEMSYHGTFDWDGGSFSVPEPNSMVLCLIGIGFLLLRRKTIFKNVISMI